MRAVLLAVLLAGCGSSVETMLDDAAASVAGSGGGASVGAVVGSGADGSTTVVGSGGSAAATGAGGYTGAGGEGGAGGAACVDPDPWACHPYDDTPICDVMPTACGDDICPDDVGHCRQTPCVIFWVDMATGACVSAAINGGPHMCGPDNAWDCVGTADLWSCCVDGNER